MDIDLFVQEFTRTFYPQVAVAQREIRPSKRRLLLLRLINEAKAYAKARDCHSELLPTMLLLEMVRSAASN